MAKNTSLEQTLAAAGVHVDVPEIVVPERDHVETVAESDIARVARLESFMNEVVRIRIATTTDPNAPPFVTLTVNSPQNRAQLPRGYVCGVKRMFVEVLARMRETRYFQPARNPMEPESGNQIIPRDAWVYPFEVIEDKNPLGREWLERVLAEAN